MTKKLTQEIAGKVLAMVVSRYFNDDLGNPHDKAVKKVTYTESGRECVLLDNGQVYEFTIKLTDDNK
jgi:hypothetical protein